MAMRNLIEGLGSTGDPRDLERAKIVAAMLEARGSDFSLSPDVAPEETRFPPQEFRLFTVQERTALEKDGAHILSLTGEGTIGEHIGYEVEGSDELFRLPQIEMELAIYTEPKKFPIPDSEGKDSMTSKQLEQLAEKDGQELRGRLGIEDDSLRVIIPNPVSTLTELIRTCLVGTPNEDKRIQAFHVGHTTLFIGNEKAADQADHPFGRSTLEGVPGLGDHAVVVNRCLGFMGHLNSRVVRLVVARKK